MFFTALIEEIGDFRHHMKYKIGTKSLSLAVRDFNGNSKLEKCLTSAVDQSKFARTSSCSGGRTGSEDTFRPVRYSLDEASRLYSLGHPRGKPQYSCIHPAFVSSHVVFIRWGRDFPGNSRLIVAHVGRGQLFSPKTLYAPKTIDGLQFVIEQEQNGAAYGIGPTVL